MKCHYEVLGVPMDATADDLKKAYRKLALQWHPDKNLGRLEEAKEQFQLIQQAYEVLADPHERAWYDRHRDVILKGGFDDYKDDCLNVFNYFNTACFSGYDDNDKSFYTVYRDVFNKIAAEDQPFIEEENFEIPSFGNSTSSYEEVVHPFYAYWMSYCTLKSFSWVDKYDIREAPNRRVMRLMEKENKKLRDQFKKKRNEEVRNLVFYVKKRDKRVQTYRKKLEEKNAENARKMQEQRCKQIQERQKTLENYQEPEWISMTQLEEQLLNIEASLDKEFGKMSSSDDGCEQDIDDEEDFDDLYCVACDKAFRSDKAMKNHENSKKHKENAHLLKLAMEEEEKKFLSNTSDQEPEVEQLMPDESSEEGNPQNSCSLENSDLESEQSLSSDQFVKKKKQKNVAVHSENDDEDLIKEDVSDIFEQPLNDEVEEIPCTVEQLPSTSGKSELLPTSEGQSGSKPKTKKMKETKKKMKNNENTEKTDKQTSNKCEKCSAQFNSRNKLFEHLKSTGHALYIPANKNELKSCHSLQEETKKSRRSKR